MPERFRRGLNGLLVLLILGALAYASALLFGWNCPIKYLIGVPCPGCGLSRALAALLRLDFRTALRFHPMVFVLPPVVFVRAVWQKATFRLQKPRAHAAVERYRAGYRNLADTSRAA